MKSLFRAAAAVLCLAAPGAVAFAAAPQPAHPIAASFYSGRWYEIARLPNAGQKDCQAPTTDFVGQASGGYLLTQTCRKGAPTGAKKTFSTRGEVVPNTGNAKFTMVFFGVKKQEYWVLDTAPDQSWVIMATPGGNYVWLLARQATLSASAKTAAVGRLRALGYPVDRLEYPAQAS